jgi:hypothetical protein
VDGDRRHHHTAELRLFNVKVHDPAAPLHAPTLERTRTCVRERARTIHIHIHIHIRIHIYIYIHIYVYIYISIYSRPRRRP